MHLHYITIARITLVQQNIWPLHINLFHHAKKCCRKISPCENLNHPLRITNCCQMILRGRQKMHNQICLIACHLVTKQSKSTQRDRLIYVTSTIATLAAVSQKAGHNMVELLITTEKKKMQCQVFLMQRKNIQLRHYFDRKIIDFETTALPWIGTLFRW